MAEKSTAYANHVAAIVAESGADITKKFEDSFAESQKGLSALVENIAKNAPAGSEAAMAMLKSTVSASQNAIESAQNSAKNAMATAESNYAAMFLDREQAKVKATKVRTPRRRKTSTAPRGSFFHRHHTHQRRLRGICRFCF